MIPKIKDYERIVGKEVIENLKKSAGKLKGKHIVHINSTSSGGGVAEILNTLVMLMNNLGIKTGWRLLKGSQSFFKVTKMLHNALQGKHMKITKKRKELYEQFNERNTIMNHFDTHDMIVIHDPQPMAMVKLKRPNQKWFWRCHIDISHPYLETVGFVLDYLKKYDAAIFTAEQFKLPELEIPQFLITPSIDPLSQKNKFISEEKAKKLMQRYGIENDKPLITQVSRFDIWKDPLGVIKTYQLIKKKKDCRLVLMGDMASDDPEGPGIYAKVIDKAEQDKDIIIIAERNDLLVNALQRYSDIILQKSKREGFALTITEALWKETPVVASNVGGIPLQVIDGKTGFLANTTKETAKRCIQLLENPKLGKEIGKAGKEHVKTNFLITKHLQNYLDLFSGFV